MEKRIIKSEKAGKLTPAMLKAMAAITGAKENKYRPFLQYVHYNANEKRLEVTDGRCLATVAVDDIMPENEREGFFTIVDNLLVESEYTGNFPNCNYVIPSSEKMEHKAYITTLKKKGEERAIRVTALTGLVFGIGEKSIVAAFGFSEFTAIEWNLPTNPIKLYDSYCMAVIMPMANPLGCFEIVKGGEIAERKAV